MSDSILLVDTSSGKQNIIISSGAQGPQGPAGVPIVTAGALFSGNDTQTVFSITHNLTGTPSWFQITPTSANAAGNFYVTANSTQLIITYINAPVLGTNNISINWAAKL